MKCKKVGCNKPPISRGKYCVVHRTVKKLCKTPECTSGARAKSDYCSKHGGGKRCIEPGCPSGAQGSTDYCVAHGGGKRCAESDCKFSAQGTTGYCKKHGGGKRCAEPGCESSAVCPTNYCKRHGGGKRCAEQDCSSSAEGATKYCKRHGGGNRCTTPGCPNSTQGSTDYCISHGGGKRCVTPDCSYGAQGATNYCKRHGGGKRCIEPRCKSCAESPTDYCIAHGGGKRCKEPGCPAGAQSPTDYCISHGGGKRCPNCVDWPDSRSGKPKYDGYCATCFKRVFPDDPRSVHIYEHTKEIRVRNAISKESLSNPKFKGFIHDRPLYTWDCECTHRRRVDHRKLIGNTMLAVETDEFAHKGYDKTNEEIRYDDLYMIHSGKWIFIRFNPDITKTQKVDLEDRIVVLIKEMKKNKCNGLRQIKMKLWWR